MRAGAGQQHLFVLNQAQGIKVGLQGQANQGLISLSALQIFQVIFLKRRFSIIRVSQSVRTRQLTLFVNLGRLELTYRV